MSRNAQRIGYANCFIVAVGVVSSVPGTLYFLVDGSNRSDILIPVFEISSSDYSPIQNAIQNGSEVLLIATSGDANEWVTFYTGPAGIVFAVIFVPLNAALALFAIVKLALILKRSRKFLSVPVISLLIEFVACVLRALATIDMVGAFRIFSWGGHVFLFLMNIPLTTSVTILIALYWHEMITSFKVTSAAWIQKYQILFWVFCILLVLISLILVILIASYVVSTTALAIISIVYVLIALGTALYFFIVGGRAIRFFKQFKSKVLSKDKVPKRVLKKTTYLVIQTGVGNVAFTTAAVLFIFYQGYIIGAYVCFTLFYVALAFIALSHIMTFNPLSKEQSKSSSKSVGGQSGHVTSPRVASGVSDHRPSSKEDVEQGQTNNESKNAELGSAQSKK